MGASGGPLSSVITYDVATRRVNVARGVSSEVHEESIFDYLSREMKRLRYLSDDLPFDFNCGFVGYFGYELKADVEGDLPHQSAMPDAAFIFADRLIAFDHYEKCVYLLCVTEPTSEDEGRRWIAETAARLDVDAAARAGRAEPGAGERAGRVLPEPLAPAVPRRHRARARST